MKPLFMFIVMLMFFFSCEKDNHVNEPDETIASCEGPIKITFYNNTSFDISAIEIDGMNIGNLGANDAKGLICFDRFRVDTGLPDCQMKGIYQGKILGSTSQFYWCGTEKGPLGPGNYDIEINVVEWGNETYFDLRFKR